MTQPTEHLRIAEALLFAAAEPLDLASLQQQMPDGVDVPAVLAELAAEYQQRGVNLVEIGGKWSLRTAPDLRHVLERHIVQPRKLSRAAIETLAIVAYHQPVTRAEIEEIRGVAISKGTLDSLFEAGWTCLRGRRKTPGRPVTYGTTEQFLEHFGLEALSALPGLDELKATGLLRSEPPAPNLFDAAAPDEAEDGEADRDAGADDGASDIESGTVVPLKPVRGPDAESESEPEPEDQGDAGLSSDAEPVR